MRAYYYFLYKFYRLQQVMARWPLARRDGLHFNAAALAAFCTLAPLIPLLLRFSFYVIPPDLPRKLAVSIFILLVFGPPLLLAAYNYYLFRRPRWYQYIVEFRGLPPRAREWGTLKVAGIVGLLLISSCAALSHGLQPRPRKAPAPRGAQQTETRR